MNSGCRIDCRRHVGTYRDLLNEPTREACLIVLEREEEVFISAGTLAQAYIVAISRKIDVQLVDLVKEMRIAVIPMDEAFSYQAGEVHREWGKGRHRAALNYGDCFSYAAAKMYDAPLLFIGDDLSQTDIRSVL